MTDTDQTNDRTVRRSTVVEAPIQRAFEVYLNMTAWWPMATHHIGANAPVEVVVDRRVGGRIFERDAEGNENEWGVVLEYHPYDRFVYSWHLQGDFSYDPDVTHASEIETRFISETPARTRVEIDHRRIDAHGATARAVFDAVSSSGGWSDLLARYRTSAQLPT